MRTSGLLEQLMESLRCLPGVGPKSAQRMAFHLLQRNRQGGMQLADSLSRAMSEIGHCSECRTFTEEDTCAICLNPKRQASGELCIVESPADIVAVEATGQFSGRYFVLMGHLSPIDGIGPEDIGLDKLMRLVSEASIKEVILATNSTIEGDATAFYIADLLEEQDVLVTRIAHGIPVGGQLGYVDGGTLGHALIGRKPIES